MPCWLYQMKDKEWPPERYRAEVWQSSDTTWNCGKTNPVGRSPQFGDTVILFYVKTKASDPGVYGWGIVMWCNGDEIRFRPAPPSDYLKMIPMWDDEVSLIVDKIRGKMKMGTMWEIDNDSLRHLRQKIAKHVGGTLSKP